MQNTLFSTDTHTVLQLTPVTDQDSAVPGTPVSLTGAISATTRWQLAPPAGVAGSGVTGTGTATIAAPYVNYKPSVADLNPPTFGVYELQLTIVYSDGSELPCQSTTVQIVQAI